MKSKNHIVYKVVYKMLILKDTLLKAVQKTRTFYVCPSNGVNLILARAMNFPQHLITQVCLPKTKTKLLILS